MTSHHRSVARAGWALATAILLLAGSGPFSAETVRPSEWAAPVRIDGAPNLHRITPDLYRGAQPSLQGFRNLKALGIQTVINLRDGDHDDRAVAEMGFRFELVPLSAMHIRPDANVRILRLLSTA